MEVGTPISSSVGYGKPPWIFKGRQVQQIHLAWYQLHLVKAEKARACIPKELRLVEAFGYTLGGFFLANYEDSPAGAFDELVVIAGLVWSRHTSCAYVLILSSS
ncbi:Protein NEOXANTHIN-DEFICIENT 1, partial [Mucuna pruriens]